MEIEMLELTLSFFLIFHKNGILKHELMSDIEQSPHRNECFD
jgi:hypothetical protein